MQVLLVIQPVFDLLFRAGKDDFVFPADDHPLVAVPAFDPEHGRRGSHGRVFPSRSIPKSCCVRPSITVTKFAAKLTVAFGKVIRQSITILCAERDGVRWR
jgi:hypothetical protein